MNNCEKDIFDKLELNNYLQNLEPQSIEFRKDKLDDIIFEEQPIVNKPSIIIDLI